MKVLAQVLWVLVAESLVLEVIWVLVAVANMVLLEDLIMVMVLPKEVNQFQILELMVVLMPIV